MTISAPDRVAYANVGAEGGPLPKKPPRPVARLVELFTSIVDDPPWPWLERARGLVPWLVTVHAERWAAERALSVWGAPSAVVDVVHDKAFAVRIAREKRVDEEIADVAVVLERDEVSVARIRVIAEEWPRWAWARFTVKPRWGTSGRLRVAGVDGQVRGLGAVAPQFERGAVVEPWLDRVVDLSSLWFVDEHGEPHLLGTTKQIVRGSGVWLGCDVVIGAGAQAAAGTEWDDDAVERARVVVEAAAAAGYRGPCGVDAFAWRDGAGAVHLRGVVELNARFTAGHVALALVARQAPAPGARFSFRLDEPNVLTVA